VARRGVMVLELLFPAIGELVGAASVYCSRKSSSVSTMVSVLRRWEREVVLAQYWRRMMIPKRYCVSAVYANIHSRSIICFHLSST
jgi:hypothetical protein